MSLLVDKRMPFILAFSLFNPSLAFLISLKSKFGLGKCFIFCLFFFIVGLCFQFTGNECDAIAYAREFDEICRFGLNDLEFSTGHYYTIFISYVVSLFTSNPSVLFGVYGTIFGLLIYNFLKVLNDDLLHGEKWSFKLVVLVLAIFLLNPYTNINAMRFWSAMWAFLIGIVSLLVNKTARGYVYIFLSFFMHLTFILPFCVYVFYKLIFYKIDYKTSSILVLFSCLLMFILDANSISSLIGQLSVFSHYNAYLDKESISEFKTDTNSISTLNLLLTTYPRLLVSFFAFLVYKGFITLKNQLQKLLYNLFAIYMSFAYVTVCIPSMGRFFVLSYSVFLLWIFVMVLDKNIIVKNNFIFLLVFLFAFSATYFRNYEVHTWVLGVEYMYFTFIDIANLLSKM